MSQLFCQSCGMPMEDEKLLGTNEDLTQNPEYCTYCYQEGKFTSDITMDQMIEICIPHMVKEGMVEQEARTMISGLLPNLKRWK